MLNGNRTKSTRARSPRDLYITPQDLANAAMYRFRVDKEFPEKYPLYALDAGCGTGVWGKPIAHLLNVYGIDLQLGIDKSNHDYDETIEGDFLQYDWGIKFDLIFGNPPYCLGGRIC